jgi:hypothetical protein
MCTKIRYAKRECKNLKFGWHLNQTLVLFSEDLMLAAACTHVRASIIQEVRTVDAPYLHLYSILLVWK